MVSIPIAVSKEAVVFAEILAVTSTMRKNSRWASSSGLSYPIRGLSLANPLRLRRAGASSDSPNNSGKYEIELMMGFLDLKRQVRDIENIEELPLTLLFSPFLSLIRSPLSTGPITSAALSAIHNFFVAGFVTANSLGLELALSELSNAVSHCKFEASDASGDEVVLYRIMAVIKECMCGSVGHLLGDVEVCEMLETVLTTCCQMRLSEILRRYAESTMHALVRQVFYRLHSLDPAREEEKVRDDNEEKRENEIRVDMQLSSSSNSTTINTESSQTAAVVDDEKPAVLEKEMELYGKGDTVISSDPSRPDMPPREEYGLPSVLELLRVLINILDPNDRLHTDSTRLTALGILNAALEVLGSRIGDFPSLSNLILDHGCKYLFQLARSDNSTVLCLAMRVISTIFDTMRSHLKLQRELFFVFTIDRLDAVIPNKTHASSKKDFSQSRPGTSGTVVSNSNEKEKEQNGRNRSGISPARGETRELMLETLSHIARHPSFMVDLYVNYDCDVNCEELFEKLIDLLTKGIYPTQSANGFEGQQQASQLLCLDIILELIKHMASRAEGNRQAWPQNFPTPENLLESKSRKRLVLSGAQKFNMKPKIGISFLEENKLIYSDLSENVDRPKSLARFLKECTRIDKRLLGDFISRPENIDVLKAFVGLFDFRNKPISEAMRELLESFRLPGESQPIARITEVFAEHYFSSGNNDVKSQDAAYVLAYSVIMLNTDLHNPQNRKRMAVEDYQRNLRGVNDGADFSTDYLKTVYDSIRKREIVMPEEHTGRLGFEYAWKELLIRSRSSGPFLSCNSDVFDMVMFNAVWKSVISAIAFAFTTFDDDYTVQRAITGFRQCATLAGHYHLPDVFDYVVVSLSQVTGLLPSIMISSVPNYPVVKVEGQDITVSALSVNFGTNFKGQLAAVVLFTIVNGNGNAVREGWTQIFELFQNLFLHSLLPSEMLQMEDFLGGTTSISLQSNQSRLNPTPRGEGGLLSALSSYLLTPYGSSSDALVPEATDTEIENTLTTLDCIAACRLEELYGQISQLESDALIAAVRALEALAYERTVARLKQEPDEYAAANSSNLSRVNSHILPYDPASIYLLETMISIAAKTLPHVEEIWPVVFEHISALLSSASQYSMLLIERAVVGLLRLCSALADKVRPSLRDQLYVSFDLLGSLPPSVVAAVGEQITAGLSHVLKSHKGIIRSHTEWGLLFALMRNSCINPEGAKQSFGILLSLVQDGADQCITRDNFVGLISLLNYYAEAVNVAIGGMGEGPRRDNRRLTQENVMERGRKTLDLLYDLKKYVPVFVLEANGAKIEAWREYGLPLIACLGRQCSNSSREIRHAALINLQRLLLGQQIILDDDLHLQVEDIFNRIVFPLVDDLLDLEIFQRDPQGMPETRLRSSALLCKTFMHYAIREDLKTDINVLWKQTLDLLDRLMNIDKRDQLYEAVPESLKNVILVMNASGLLIPPTGDDKRSEEQVLLWNSTHERIEQFLPGFLEAILPGTKPEVSTPSQNVDIHI